jgi:hypothetical protein
MGGRGSRRQPPAAGLPGYGQGYDPNYGMDYYGGSYDPYMGQRKYLFRLHISHSI